MSAESQLKALQRLETALRQIEHAQNTLNAACAELSHLIGGIAAWEATGKEADRVKALWYRVAKLRHSRKLDHD